MKIKQFDSSNLKILRDAINNRLSFLELDYNIKIKLGNIKFSDQNFDAQLNVALVVNGEVIEKIATDFERYKDSWGLDFPLGFEFTMGFGENPEIYKVVGLKPRNRKYPIIA